MALGDGAGADPLGGRVWALSFLTVLKAIARTTPLLLGLFSIITLIADHLHQENGIVVRSARWYRKDHITFTDALAAVRRHIWTQQTFATSPPDRHPQQTPAAAFDRLVNLA